MMNNKKIQPKEYVEGETTIKELNIEKVDLAKLDTEEFLKETHHLVNEFVSTKQRILADERKMQAIGTALISQKGYLEDIKHLQDQHRKLTESNLEDISRNQDQVGEELSNILTATRDVEGLQEEQTELIHTLSEFQEQHKKMVEQTKAESEKTINELESINVLIDLLTEELEGMGLQEKVSGLSKGIESIYDILLEVKEDHNKARDENSNKMEELIQQVVGFRQDVSDKGLIHKLYTIQQSSDANGERVMDLSYKIDLFIEEYELSQDKEDISLEKLFGDNVAEKLKIENENDPTSAEYPEPPSEKPSEKDTEETITDSHIRDISTEDHTKKRVDEAKGIEEDLYGTEDTFGEGSPHLSGKETQNKKGIFNKLFGGW